MSKTFRPYEPDQPLLMPPALSDWVPEKHLARFVGDVVDGLDLSAIEDAYDEERGYLSTFHNATGLAQPQLPARPIHRPCAPIDSASVRRTEPVIP